MKPKTLLMIVLVNFIYFVKTTSSEEVTPKLDLGNKCAALPEVGESNLRMLIQKNCYVDKTEYLFKMVNRTQPFWLLARPRRFGKTLLINVLEAFFSGLKKLFKDTAIYHQHVTSFLGIKYTSGWPENPVIRLDFSSIEAKSHHQFYRCLLALLQERANMDGIHLDAQDISTALRLLIKKLKEKYGKKVVILIDEYDSAYTEIYTNNKDEASQVLGTLQSFFKALKAACKNIRFSFTTGITRLALSDFFSGANAAVDLTMDPEYANILGFTENELTQYFGGFIEKIAKEKGKTTTEIVGVMRKWHNGFRFTTKNENLYSPISVIGYLRNDGDLQSYSDTAGVSQIFVERLTAFPLAAVQFLIDDDLNRKTDEPKKKMVISANKKELTGKCNFEDSTDSTALVTFLFHSGYLSIRSFDEKTKKYTLDFSNLELKEDFKDRLASTLTGLTSTSRDKTVKSMKQNLANHEWKALIFDLENLLSRLPLQLNKHQKTKIEAFFHAILYVLFLKDDHGVYETQPSMEVSTNKGFVDIVVTIENTTIIFEPKMESNPENPVYECKAKFLRAHLFDSDYVVCFGLKFIFEGHIQSWGIAKFSRAGELLEEDGDILLTTQFDARQKENITNQLKDFKMKRPSFSLQSEKLFEFLEQIGPTIIDEGLFARKFTTDIETLCTFLSINNNLFEPNLKSAIKSFVKRNSPKRKKKGKKGTSGKKEA